MHPAPVGIPARGKVKLPAQEHIPPRGSLLKNSARQGRLLEHFLAFLLQFPHFAAGDEHAVHIFALCGAPAGEGGERGILEAVTGIPVLGMIPSLKRPVPVIALRSPAAKGTHAVALAPKKTTERKLALEAFRSLVVDLGFVGRNLGNGGLRSLAFGYLAWS